MKNIIIMKKHLFLVAIIGFGVATLCSCGNSNSGNSNKEEKMDMDYRDAIKALDFETARDIMNTYHERYLEELSKDGILNREERKKAEGMYYSAFDNIYKAEIQYLLSELNGDECKDKIAFLLEEIPVEGEKFPQGLCSYYIASRGDFVDDGLPLDAYIVWTQHFNRLCDTILSLAINRRNQDLATMILLKYVDTVEVTIGDGPGIVVDGVKVDGDHGYIKYTSADRDAARKKYDEAVRIGAFK